MSLEVGKAVNKSTLGAVVLIAMLNTSIIGASVLVYISCTCSSWYLGDFPFYKLLLFNVCLNLDLKIKESLLICMQHELIHDKLF